MLNILITRPLSSAISLSDKIAKQIKNNKINTIIFPVIDIIEINLSQIDLSEIDMMVFISPAAVEHAVFYIKNNTKNMKNSISLFSIGKDTAEKIQKLGLAWSTVIHPSEKFNSEALLDLQELQNIRNKNIVIFKGESGNPTLSDTLKTRGAKVIEAVVYERRLPQPKTLPDLNIIDLILCTSSESMNNLISLLGEAVKEKRLLVSSEKLILLAKMLGFKQTPLLAQNAGDEAIIAVLLSYPFAIRE